MMNQTLGQRATLRLIRKRRKLTPAGWFWTGYAVAVAVLVICS